MDYQIIETNPAEEGSFPQLDIAPDLDESEDLLMECWGVREMDFGKETETEINHMESENKQSQGDMTKDTENSTQLANSQNTEECEGTDMTIDDSVFTPVRSKRKLKVGSGGSQSRKKGLVETEKEKQISTDLYRSEHRDSKELLDTFYQGLPKVSSEENAALEGPLVLEELHAALNTMPGGKAPGIDGLPVELYKFFFLSGKSWEKICWRSSRKAAETVVYP
ncbi:hypothetical protein QTP70_031135 [Hemibagrus guttatus]|uniref:Reverse transcriptase n=1 Tax=Hemibagrus guttatus TaxID=175788 RepID=A0AAE0V1Z2_9TELE|nr:hypothetical protein QTP70_031135 [Hemibagrus guttatus]